VGNSASVWLVLLATLVSASLPFVNERILVVVWRCLRGHR